MALFDRGNTLIQKFWTSAIVETVSLKVRSPNLPDVFTTYTGITAVRRALRKEELAGREASLMSALIVFHLRASTVPAGVTIRAGDAITGADGMDYWIDSATLQTWDSRWRAECSRSVQSGK